MKDSEKYFRRLAMSVVIIGGHDRMVCQYKQICKQFKCKAKVFTQMSAAMSKQIGSPDLIVLLRTRYHTNGTLCGRRSRTMQCGGCQMPYKQ